MPFQEIRYNGPYAIEKVLPNGNYFVRKLNTNKTQIPQIRLRKYNPKGKDNLNQTNSNPNKSEDFKYKYF